MQKLFPVQTLQTPGAFTPTDPTNVTEELKKKYNLLRSMGRNLWPDTTEF
jgi:hypothetical protein